MVDDGELECFHPETAGAARNKAEWLRAVLEQRLYENSPRARILLASVASFILGRQ
jgi:hypothetical protein